MCTLIYCLRSRLVLHIYIYVHTASDSVYYLILLGLDREPQLSKSAAYVCFINRYRSEQYTGSEVRRNMDNAQSLDVA